MMYPLLIFFAVYLQVTQPFQTLIVDFHREYLSNTGRDVSAGRIFYNHTGKLVVTVKDPIDQILVFSEKTLVIYYPVEKQAFKIESEMPFSLPFVSALIGSSRPNYGLPDMKYTLKQTERKSDTLISHWEPPSMVSPVLGPATLVEHRRRLIYAESKRANGQVMTMAHFRNHIMRGNLVLALDVETTHFIKEGVEIEKIAFANPAINSPIPDSLLNFQIPSGTPTKNVKWW
jgi:outer membrane lipoprotein-sorting protein